MKKIRNGNSLTIKKTLILAAILYVGAVTARAAEDPDYGAPVPVRFTQMQCEGLDDALRDRVLAEDFTVTAGSCRIMCQACGVCKCLTGQFDAVDPALGYSLKREHVSCEGTRYTLEAGGRTYACEAPRLEYPTIKAPAGLHYPGAATIGYSYDIETLVRRKTYVLSTPHDYKDVIAYYAHQFLDTLLDTNSDRSEFTRTLGKSNQRVEVEKNGADEVLITVTTSTPEPDDTE